MQLTAIVNVNIVFSHLVSCTALHSDYNSEAVAWAARAVAMALGYWLDLAWLGFQFSLRRQLIRNKRKTEKWLYLVSTLLDC